MIPILCVDAFATKPFSGNQAAVCFTDSAAVKKEDLGIDMQFTNYR
ncbi:MAG: PhzF family phenazine biosynthesis protein [Nitrospinae bacterium]|nr:PhzF family phenazine biosynthesis protein [Nitrospinota bacterium]